VPFVRRATSVPFVVRASAWDATLRFLFVHQNFPGQFLHIVRHLVAMGGHEIVFITEPNANIIAGVRKVPYAKPRPGAADLHMAARDLDAAARRADVVARTAETLKALGFTPDIIIGHHGWGEMLNLCDVWPRVPQLGYMEFYYKIDGADVVFDPEFPIAPAHYPRIRAKNAINHLALDQNQHYVTPTRWQLSTYPGWARDRIELMWEGVNLDLCTPDARARRTNLKIGEMTIRRDDKLVTYVSRDLEPYRGVHTMMRALPGLLKGRKNLKVVMVGNDGVSYGAHPPEGKTWREHFMREVGERIDPARVAFPGRIDYATYLAMLRRSDAHVYLTYPFVASWSLREALASGCAVIGSDTEPVREFITHGENGLLTSFFEPDTLAATVLNVLENRKLDQSLRTGARRYAERHLAMPDYLRAFCKRIETLTGLTLTPPAPGRSAPVHRRARVGR
jgi:glycosyltransferase involved in cell wall biosynthesis